MNRLLNRTLAFFCLLFILLFPHGPLQAQVRNPLLSNDSERQKEWVDSIYGQMSVQEKIGQLFIVGASTEHFPNRTSNLKTLLEEYKLGGVVFSKGGPKRQAEMTNELQELSKIPLFIGMDVEGGLGQSLDSAFAFPGKMALSAVEDHKIVEEVGSAIARDAKRLGVRMNFSSVAELANYQGDFRMRDHPFDENKEKAAQKSLAFLKGMQRHEGLAIAEFFSEHGDLQNKPERSTKTDFSEKRMKEGELSSYRRLIEEGVSGIMVGHREVAAIEGEKSLSASLSKAIITNFLKETLGFKGLIITDALDEKGISENLPPEEIGLNAFLAGNDLLLMPKNVKRSFKKIYSAYSAGVISEERLEYSVKKILSAKYKAGLANYQSLSTSYLYQDMNSVRNLALREKIYENAHTVIKNNKGIIPIKELEKKKIAYVGLGNDSGLEFFEQLSSYGKVDWIKSNSLKGLINDLEKYNLVLVGIHKASGEDPTEDPSFSEREMIWLNEIASRKKVIVSLFTSPISLLGLSSTAPMEGIVIGFENHPVSQKKAAQLIFGALEAKGKLPVAIGPDFPEGTGFKTENLSRLSYGIPESVGVNSYKLKRIDSLIDLTIEEKMAPGVQVLVARKGKVIYNRSAGYHTYEKENPVNETDIYDLASLTKILGTLPLVMELVDKNEMDLDTKLHELLPGFRKTNKGNANIQQMLSHYARFKSWIPFYRFTYDPETGKPDDRLYRSALTQGYTTKVAEGMYLKNTFRDSIMKVIKESDLEKKLEYKYSDLPYFILKFYLENTYGTSLNYLTQEHLFKPLGANFTTYLPLDRFPEEQIVPTENDQTWRNQLLRGYVHDEGAALLGGVAGHAGIFSNANDVAKIMQMYLNGGSYGGRKFFEKETIEMFNTCYYCKSDVRRGVGFDKPQLEDSGPTCGCVSMSSFGHSGFSGTFTWADPHEEIVYVFLSNRIHPSVSNNKLGKESIREKIQEIIYEAIDYN